MRAYKGDFEVHLTARMTSEALLGRFRGWCRAREVKCVQIVLGRGRYVQQPMATWRQRGSTLFAVMEEAIRCVAEMNRAGLPIARVKIEAAPQNEEVPVLDEDATAREPGNYFEHHIKLLRPAMASREALLRTCERYGAHLSHNALREIAEGQEERFVTLRSYGAGRTSSEEQLRRLLTAVHDLGERVIECESEYCVYDSNVELDSGWLAQS